MRCRWNSKMDEIFDVQQHQNHCSNRQSLAEKGKKNHSNNGQIANFDVVSVKEEVQEQRLKVEDTRDDEDNSSSDGEDNMNLDEDYEGPVVKKRRMFPWGTETLNLLDRSMINDTAAATILTASVVELGLDSGQISSSSSTIRRHREAVGFFIHKISNIFKVLYFIGTNPE